MAIAFDAAGGSVGSASPGTATASHTHTMGSVTNGIAFVAVYNQNTGGLSSVTFGGNAMTLIGSKQDSGSNIVYLYVILNPSSGANTVSVTRSSTTGFMFLLSSSYSGAAQTTTADATTSGNATATSLTGTLTTIANNCWTIMIASAANGSQAAGSGSTRRVDSSGFQGLFDSNAAKTPAGSTSMTVTSASGAYAYFMSSFAPALDPILLTETVTSTDTISRVGTFVRSLTENGTFTPSASTARVLPFAITESTTLTDSVSRTAAFVRSLTDTANVSDLTLSLSLLWTPRVKPTSIWTDRTKPTTTWT